MYKKYFITVINEAVDIGVFETSAMAKTYLSGLMEGGGAKIADCGGFAHLPCPIYQQCVVAGPLPSFQWACDFSLQHGTFS